MKHDFIGQQQWPTNVVMPAGSQHIAEWVMGLLVGAAVLWGLRNILMRREPALLICMLGGALACVLEVHTMDMLKFFYPQVGQNVFLVGFGRPIPVFLMLMYSAFFGLSSYLYVAAGQPRSFSVKSFSIGMGTLFVAEAVLEVVSINGGIWAYFDDQPFLLMDFPIHVAVIVGCMSVVLGSIARVWFDRVKGVQQWWMLILCPVILTATFETFTYPFAFAVSSEGGLAAARIGSLMSIALSLGLTYCCAKGLAAVPNVSSPARAFSSRISAAV